VVQGRAQDGRDEGPVGGWGKLLEQDDAQDHPISERTGGCCPGLLRRAEPQAGNCHKLSCQGRADSREAPRWDGRGLCGRLVVYQATASPGRPPGGLRANMPSSHDRMPPCGGRSPSSFGDKPGNLGGTRARLFPKPPPGLRATRLPGALVIAGRPWRASSPKKLLPWEASGLLAVTNPRARSQLL